MTPTRIFLIILALVTLAFELYATHKKGTKTISQEYRYWQRVTQWTSFLFGVSVGLLAMHLVGDVCNQGACGQ